MTIVAVFSKNREDLAKQLAFYSADLESVGLRHAVFYEADTALLREEYVRDVARGTWPSSLGFQQSYVSMRMATGKAAVDPHTLRYGFWANPNARFLKWSFADHYDDIKSPALIAEVGIAAMRIAAQEDAAKQWDEEEAAYVVRHQETAGDADQAKEWFADDIERIIRARKSARGRALEINQPTHLLYSRDQTLIDARDRLGWGGLVFNHNSREAHVAAANPLGRPAVLFGNNWYDWDIECGVYRYWMPPHPPADWNTELILPAFTDPFMHSDGFRYLSLVLIQSW